MSCKQFIRIHTLEDVIYVFSSLQAWLILKEEEKFDASNSTENKTIIFDEYKQKANAISITAVKLVFFLKNYRCFTLLHLKEQIFFILDGKLRNRYWAAIII